jgi:hypothetical protein
LAADFTGALGFGLTSGRFFSAMILYRINKNVIAARSKKLVIFGSIDYVITTMHTVPPIRQHVRSPGRSNAGISYPATIPEHFVEFRASR